MPAAKLAGGIRFCRPEDDDSMWWCEPCDSIEGNIDELEEGPRQRWKKHGTRPRKP